MTRTPRFQPGWATPIVVDYGAPSLLLRFLGLFRDKEACRMREIGNCPGLDHCHDCAWSDLKKPR